MLVSAESSKILLKQAPQEWSFGSPYIWNTSGSFSNKTKKKSFLLEIISFSCSAVWSWSNRHKGYSCLYQLNFRVWVPYWYICWSLKDFFFRKSLLGLIDDTKLETPDLEKHFVNIFGSLIYKINSLLVCYSELHIKLYKLYVRFCQIVYKV